MTGLVERERERRRRQVAKGKQVGTESMPLLRTQPFVYEAHALASEINTE